MAGVARVPAGTSDDPTAKLTAEEQARLERLMAAEQTADKPESSAWLSPSISLRYSAASITPLHYKSLIPPPARGKAEIPMFSPVRCSAPAPSNYLRSLEIFAT